jgi:uncharacterized protein
MSDDQAALTNFSGKARLFPLPNLVMFPHVVQPLHVFEPRYRSMTADALTGDKLIALVLLKPGWEEDYEGRPAVHEVACLGRVIADQKLEDGRYNLLLRGLVRVRLVRELDTAALFRSAKVEVLADVHAPEPAEAVRLRRLLAETAPAWFPGQDALLTQLRQMFDSELDLGTLCDIFSFALPLDVEFKQELLATVDVGARATRLLDQLNKQGPPAARQFPPPFSDN